MVAQIWFFFCSQQCEQPKSHDLSILIWTSFICGPKSDTGLIFCNATSVWTVISEFMRHLRHSRSTFVKLVDNQANGGQHAVSRPCCRPIQPNSYVLSQGDGSPEPGVLLRESCGEALTDAVKSSPWHPEIWNLKWNPFLWSHSRHDPTTPGFSRGVYVCCCLSIWQVWGLKICKESEYKWCVE